MKPILLSSALVILVIVIYFLNYYYKENISLKQKIEIDKIQIEKLQFDIVLQENILSKYNYSSKEISKDTITLSSKLKPTLTCHDPDPNIVEVIKFIGK